MDSSRHRLDDIDEDSRPLPLLETHPLLGSRPHDPKYKHIPCSPGYLHIDWVDLVWVWHWLFDANAFDLVEELPLLIYDVHSPWILNRPPVDDERGVLLEAFADSLITGHAARTVMYEDGEDVLARRVQRLVREAAYHTHYPNASNPRAAMSVLLILACSNVRTIHVRPSLSDIRYASKSIRCLENLGLYEKPWALTRLTTVNWQEAGETSLTELFPFLALPSVRYVRIERCVNDSFSDIHGRAGKWPNHFPKSFVTSLDLVESRVSERVIEKLAKVFRNDCRVRIDWGTQRKRYGQLPRWWSRTGGWDTCYVSTKMNTTDLENCTGEKVGWVRSQTRSATFSCEDKETCCWPAQRPHYWVPGKGRVPMRPAWCYASGEKPVRRSFYRSGESPTQSQMDFEVTGTPDADWPFET